VRLQLGTDTHRRVWTIYILHHLWLTWNVITNKWSKSFDKKATPLPQIGGSIVFASVANVHTHLIMLPWTHPSPHGKWHLNQFSCFCIAHGRVSLYFSTSCPLKIAPSHVVCRPHLIQASLHPPECITQMESQYLNRFSHFCTGHSRDSQYYTMGQPFPFKIAPLYRGIWTLI